MQFVVCKCVDFTAATSTLQYATELKSEQHTKVATLTDEGGRAFLLQTDTINIQLTMDGRAIVTPNAPMSEACACWDAYNVNQIAERCEAWFGKALGVDVIGKRYRGLLSQQNDVELMFNDRTQFYNENGERVEHLTPGEHWVQLMLHLQGVEVHPRLVQPKIQVVQVKILPEPTHQECIADCELDLTESAFI